jgi:hypothetical protein
MSNRFDDRRPTVLEEQAHAEAREHFAEHLKQFPASREAVERLERDMARIALAANMAASKTPQGNPIQTDDGKQWHKSVDLMDNIYLCHRPITGGAEYAVVEHFPARGNERNLESRLECDGGLKGVCAGATAGVTDLDGGHGGTGEGVSGGEISRPGHEPSRGRFRSQIHCAGSSSKANSRQQSPTKIQSRHWGLKNDPSR